MCGAVDDLALGLIWMEVGTCGAGDVGKGGGGLDKGGAADNKHLRFLSGIAGGSPGVLGKRFAELDDAGVE